MRQPVFRLRLLVEPQPEVAQRRRLPRYVSPGEPAADLPSALNEKLRKEVIVALQRSADTGRPVEGIDEDGRASAHPRAWQRTG